MYSNILIYKFFGYTLPFAQGKKYKITEKEDSYLNWVVFGKSSCSKKIEDIVI